MTKHNLPHEEITRFELYEGRNTEQMPKLIADGRVPMNVAQLMQRRLDLRNDETGVGDFYMDNYFDTGDAVVYHPDGRVKIVLDSQYLRDMIPESPRNGGALILGEDVYKALEGEEFKKGKFGKVETGLSKKGAKAHPIWKVLARDQALLDDYVDYIFEEGKQRFDYDTAMGIYPDSAGNDPKMRAWYVGRFVDWSDAYGGYNLGNDVGRFAGLAPEVLSASNNGVKNVGKYTMTDLQKLDESIRGLESFVRPELLEGIKGFRGKL